MTDQEIITKFKKQTKYQKFGEYLDYLEGLQCLNLNNTSKITTVTDSEYTSSQQILVLQDAGSLEPISTLKNSTLNLEQVIETPYDSSETQLCLPKIMDVKES